MIIITKNYEFKQGNIRQSSERFNREFMKTIEQETGLYLLCTFFSILNTKSVSFFYIRPETSIKYFS